ncbi:hypothetical protein D5K91_11180, partial [Arcobacter butzleri]|nr:hypothetical protein [Aliarcobacter butzleri]
RKCKRKKEVLQKSINFGLLYGMGSKKLGETLGIPSRKCKRKKEVLQKSINFGLLYGMGSKKLGETLG